LKLWHGKTGDEVGTLVGHSDSVKACAFSPDGRRIISASDDNTLRLWDGKTGDEVGTLVGHSDSVRTCAFSPDGRLIVSASDDGTLKLWDGKTGNEVGSLVGHSDSVRACAFSPDGRLIVSASDDNTLKLWDGKTGDKVGTLVGHSDSVRACAFSPDGRRIVSASMDKILKVWDVGNQETVASFFSIYGVVNTIFVFAGQIIFAGDKEGKIYLLKLENFTFGPMFVTPVYIYLYDNKKYPWDNAPKVKCEWCGKKFEPDAKIIDAINGIQNLDLTSNQPSNPSLATEIWKKHNFLSNCPYCNNELRLNKFIVDNRRRN
jgi:WD40 repeat protein